MPSLEGRQVLQDRTLWLAVRVAATGKLLKRLLHRLHFADLRVQLVGVLFRESLDVAARAGLIVP